VSVHPAKSKGNATLRMRGTVAARGSGVVPTRVPDPRDDPAVIAEAILAYLRENPRAADTLEGICQWWFGRDRPPPSRVEVGVALELLVARGRVVQHAKSDGVVIYHAAPARH
jgi:hypothetical protein